MAKRAILVGLCCAGAVAIAAPTASAATVNERVCTADADWSLTSSTAAVTYTNTTCNSNEAWAALQGLFPDYGVTGGVSNDPSLTQTFSYIPLVGFCDGRIAGWAGSYAVTGVLHNDGALHNTVVLEYSNNGVPDRAGRTVATGVGALQNACSTSFQQKIAWAWAEVDS